MFSQLIVLFYTITLLAMASYGIVGLITLCLYWRHRRTRFTTPHLDDNALPVVTVQLPIYNERFVVERLINAAVRLDYPADRLQIQVIDDSTDDTTARARELVASYRRQGIDIELLHRRDRRGFKAGALAAALAEARGSYLAIFDADFAPPADFLRRTVPHFAADNRLGAIQARWTHLNRAQSPLCRAQALALDKHFVMDQGVRHYADLFPKFNGSAGVWRRTCLEDAGGWSADTVCEDLDLSTRAVLRGWQFRFLNDVTAAAELPATITAFKTQQARWAAGSLQCLLKFGSSILRDRRHSLLARVYALLSMGAYLSNLFFLLLLLLLLPLLLAGAATPGWLWPLAIIGATQPLLFVWAQRVLHDDWPRRIRDLPIMIVIMTGLSVSQSRAILHVLLGERPSFIRTPKGIGQWQRYRMPVDWLIGVEVAFALYALLTALCAVLLGRYGMLPLPLLSIAAFVSVICLDLRAYAAPRLELPVRPV